MLLGVENILWTKNKEGLTCPLGKICGPHYHNYVCRGEIWETNHLGRWTLSWGWGALITPKTLRSMTEVSTAEGTGGDIAATGDIPLFHYSTGDIPLFLLGIFHCSYWFLLTPRTTQKDALRLRVGLGNWEAESKMGFLNWSKTHIFRTIPQ